MTMRLLHPRDAFRDRREPDRPAEPVQDRPSTRPSGPGSQTTGQPRSQGLEELTTDECLELLGEEELGRVALVVDGRPEIFPVNYALDDAGCIVFRTAVGMKLANAINHWVVFEVDRVDRRDRSGWSVIVHGVAHHTRTVHGAENLSPWLPDKPYLVRIASKSVTGRRLVTAADHGPGVTGEVEPGARS